MANVIMQSYFFNKNFEKEMIKQYGDSYIAYRKEWNTDISKVSDSPLQIDLDLFDACNQQCIMCHQRNRKRTNISIDIVMLTRVLTELKKHGLMAVNIGGSCEPLLKKKTLYEALSVCKDIDILDTFMHTNGILLDGATSKKIITSGLKHICISVDAATSDTYKLMRRSEDFDILEKNIVTFLSLRGENIFPQVRISFCVTALNEHEQEMFVERWHNKVDLLEFQRYKPVGPGLPGDKSWLKETACKAGFNRCMLWPDGTVSPCCQGWEGVAFGNVAQSSFQEVWTSPRAEKARAAIAAGLPQICQTCRN